MRETRAAIVHSIAGCLQCHGSEAKWQSRNSLAVAAKHHDATGHTTWCEQVLSVKYGPDFLGNEKEPAS